MLKDSTIKLLAKLAKISEADLKAAIEDKEEKDLPVDDKLEVYTAEELTTLKKNEYETGKKAAGEILVKEAKEKHGLDFQGKTIDGLLDAHSKKVLADAKIEPEKKVQELTEKVNTLQKTIQEQDLKLSQKDQEVTTVKINGELMKHIPAGTTLANDKVIGLMKMDGYDFRLEDGKLVALKDGKVINDKLSNPLPVADVLKGYVTEQKLISDAGGQGEPGGRGGGNGNPGNGKWTKLSDLQKHWTESGKNVQGQEFALEVEKAMKEYPDFKMDQ